MKKIALTIAIVLGLGMISFADNGGLFGRGEAFAETESTIYGSNRLGGAPALPNHGENSNQTAPLGSGVAVLLGFGAVYFVTKRRKE